MALIKCPECGREVSETATSCPNCGHPLNSGGTENQKVVLAVEQKFKGALSAGRLAIGIISMVLFVLVTFQSCAAGVSNALEENGESSGSFGVVLAVFMLAAGIVGVATRNSRSGAGAIVSAVLYILGGIMGLVGAGSYADLNIWGALCIIFGVFFVIAAVLNKKKSKTE